MEDGAIQEPTNTHSGRECVAFINADVLSSVCMIENETWVEGEHPIWGLGGKEADVHKHISPNMLPEKQWRKGIFSIIPPCGITFGQWELYPVDGDAMRFDTLEEAKAHADLINPSA